MTTVLFDPASAVAAGLCLTARTVAGGRTERHRRPCGWCDYPPADLRAMVAGFNEWAGWSERTHTYERHDARVFAELPREEQERQITAAQAFPELERVPVPSQPEVVSIAEADVEEGPAWLR